MYTTRRGRRLSALAPVAALLALALAVGPAAALPGGPAAVDTTSDAATAETHSDAITVALVSTDPGARIDLTTRADAARAYTGWLVPALETPVGWTGDASVCRVGEESAASRTATIAAVNYYRSMAGLPTVVEDPTWSRQALETATMMAAAQRLSHDPDPGWPCYSEAGARGARSSNLYVGPTGARAVAGLMLDPGERNYYVGHRRWILYPPATRMGTGSTSSSNALWVIDDVWRTGTRQRPAEPAWVAWPPAGPVPWEIASVVDDGRELLRWSLSPNRSETAGIDLAGARVRAVLEHGGQREELLVRVEPLALGPGDPTLVWNLRRSSDRRFPMLADAEVTVTVDGIRDRNVAGDEALDAHTYTVELFRGAFGDVAGSVHRGSIEELDARQIAGGYDDGTFRPDRDVTRGQLATFLVNAFALPAATGPARFVDTTGSTHGAAAEALAAAGIASGYDDATFRPDRVVTRGQLATFLVDTLVLPAATGPARFVDTSRSTHGESAEALAAAGLIGGYDDGTFRPDRVVMRGQLATFVANALEHAGA